MGAGAQLPLERVESCMCAADEGHLKVLKWAREQHCPWDEDTIYNALMMGHAEVALWARDNGCPEYHNFGSDDYNDKYDE